VKLSRCSRGIVVLAIVLCIFAYFFDAFPAFVAASALSFFLIIRAGLFLLALHSLVAVLDPERAISQRIVRQGSPIAVETKVNIVIPTGFSGNIWDLLPDGTFVSSGHSFDEIPHEQSHSLVLNYTLTPLVIGNHPFHGLSVSLTDQFFSTSLICTNGKAVSPSVTVLPKPGFVFAGGDRYGERESRAPEPLPDLSVRSFREYVPGDDLRKIDWKLSAKHDSLFIREFVGKAEHTSIFLIDLPDATLPFNEKAFARLKEAIVGAFMIPPSADRGFPVIFISGPNLVSSAHVIPDLPGLRRMMEQMRPTYRLHALYRFNKPENLKRRISLAPSKTMYAEKVQDISSDFLSRRPPTLFEVQIDKILQPFPAATVHLFSLADHDESHLGLLSKRAALRNTEVALHIPKESYDLGTRVRTRRCGFSLIEVF
jgi:hypothetical protein